MFIFFFFFGNASYITLLHIKLCISMIQDAITQTTLPLGKECQYIFLSPNLKIFYIIVKNSKSGFQFCSEHCSSTQMKKKQIPLNVPWNLLSYAEAIFVNIMVFQIALPYCSIIPPVSWDDSFPMKIANKRMEYSKEIHNENTWETPLLEKCFDKIWFVISCSYYYWFPWLSSELSLY